MATTLSVVDFRKRLGTSLDRVDAGERVIFRRKGHLYMVIPAYGSNAISPELSAKIEKARKEYREGKTIDLNTHEDVDRYFESM